MVLISEKQPELGLAYLRLVLRLDPGRDEAWVLVGDAMMANDDTAAARDAYSHPKPGSPQFIDARARLITTYDGHPGDNPTVLQIAQDTVKADPGDDDALTLLADALRVNEQYAESAKVLDTLITNQGDKASWQLYYMRGVARQQAGDWTTAEADMKKALTLAPDEPEVLNYLGYSWIDRGERLQEAKAMIEKAIAGKPDSGALVDSLGWAYFRMGDYKMAVDQLEHAAELEPADPDINNHLGDAYWRAGRKTEARFQWQRVLTLSPDAKMRAEVERKLKSGLGPRADASPEARDSRRGFPTVHSDTAFAAAKVNLYLHVGPTGADGFHPVSSLMVFADVGDRLALRAGEALGLTIGGRFAAGLEAGEDNLVMRAARALLAIADPPPAPFRIALTKELPLAAGLGGGSSDAGAALRLVREALAPQIDDARLEAIAAELGSDGAACLWSRPVIAEGRGEQLFPAPGLPRLDAVLVNPLVASPTGAVYRAYDAAGAPGRAERPDLPDEFEGVEELAGVLAACRNDLEAPAVALAPAIGDVLDTLRGEGETLLARVSGSGATCFALCASDIEAEGLAERLERLRPAWWVRRCRLGGPWD